MDEKMQSGAVVSHFTDRESVTHSSRSEKSRRVRYQNKYCQMCGSAFMSSRYDQKTCSAKCRKRLQRTDPTYIEPRDRQLRGKVE